MSNLYSIHSLDMQLSKVLEVDTPEELLRIRDRITDGMKSIQSFIEVVKASAKSLRTACTQAKKHVDGAATQAEAQAAAAESEEVRKAAEEARNEVERRAREVPATYKFHNLFPAVPVAESFESQWNPANPCCFKKDVVPQLTEFRQDPVVQLMLATFGSSHKKTRHSLIPKCILPQSVPTRVFRKWTSG